MNIVLIGYRGTGKTTVGRILAQRLKMELINLDDEIVALAGTDIPAIVERHGWEAFRDLESRVVQQQTKKNNAILDCGGGVILRKENVEKLKDSGEVFWLKASVDTVVQRIKDDTQRPSLTGELSFTEEVEKVLNQRLALYDKAADHEIDTDGKTPSRVAEEIVRILGY